jgi:hypothetical protein
VISLSKVVAVLVSILFVFFFIGIAYSADKEDELEVAAGVVKAFDEKSKQITILNDDKVAFKFFLDNNTVVRVNSGKTITPAEIKVGNLLIVAYKKVFGNNLARAVTVIPQAPSAKKR